MENVYDLGLFGLEPRGYEPISRPKDVAVPKKKPEAKQMDTSTATCHEPPRIASSEDVLVQKTGRFRAKLADLLVQTQPKPTSLGISSHGQRLTIDLNRF